MYRMLKRHLLVVFAACAAMLVAEAGEVRPELHIQPAERTADAAATMMLGAAAAGERIVTVGDHGVILLSDDGGKTFRQAGKVPVSSTLTSVAFADARHGWAVGHWGVILGTADGGDTWQIERSDFRADQPLFSVYFKNAHEGWAVGLWSIVLHTTDGGASWQTVKVPPPPGAKQADRNLYSIFAARDGRMFIASERGLVLSTADGMSWQYIDTGYRGSLWAGVVLSDGTVLVGGLRGTLLRSDASLKAWQTLKSGTSSSITGLVQLGDRRIVASALEGVVAISADDGATFRVSRSIDRMPYTGVVANANGQPVLLSQNGPTLRLP
jgi:photosystem II stability/assembly factor-like uncharacterized protein